MNKGKQGIELIFDVLRTSTTEGSIETLNKGEDTDYSTSLLFVLPLDREYFLDHYTVRFKDNDVHVRIFSVRNIKEDPFYPFAHNIKLGTPDESNSWLPFSVFSDNRGKYPCTYAEVVFPYRLAMWTDPTHESGLDITYNEELSITGPPPDKDIIQAMLVINQLFRDKEQVLRPLYYDDVSAFLEIYAQRNRSPFLKRFTILSSRDAYKNAVTEYYLGKKGEEVVSESIEIANCLIPQNILTEEDLQKAVISVIEGVLKHWVENRRWIEAFWDGSRNVEIDGKHISIPATPKDEVNIQPTLHILFHEALVPHGIHVVRESDEGAGKLDFKFLYTTKTGNPIITMVEFKLAQNKRIKHGLTRQLPAYLKANQSTHGIFVVFWFKDEKSIYFAEPKEKTMEETLKLLYEWAAKVKEEGNFIKPIIIDASIRPSASKV